MKRALAIERRVEEKIDEKQSLLKNVEKEHSLSLLVPKHPPTVLLRMDGVSIEMGGRILVENFSLVVEKGQRVALVGPNGCGKTTLLRAAVGEVPLKRGVVSLPRHVTWLRAYQVSL